MTTIPSGNSRPITTNTLLLTVVAMLAFAANSLLCRLALRQELFDAASFTSVRVISGAVVLSLIVLPRWRAHGRSSTDWRSAIMLFTYMIFFSFAYLSLSAGTGALILFGAVQLTMFIVALAVSYSVFMPPWPVRAMPIVLLSSSGRLMPNPGIRK